MDQMQMNMLQLMQAVTQQAPKQKPKAEGAEKQEFRDLMQQQKPDREVPEKPEAAAPSREERPQQEKVDAAALQQLAAMQLFCADTTKIVVPEEAAAMEAVGVTPLTAAAEEVQAAAQPLVEQAPQQKDPAAVLAAGEQAEAVPAVETAVKAPQQAETQDGTLEQNDGSHVEAKEVRTDKTGEEIKPDQVQVEAEGEKVFSKVETAPVKVSEAAKPAKPVPQQVTEKLTEAISKGETRVEVQLTPQNLGKITVELTQREDGSLQIALHAENSQTRSLLERELPAMQNVLSRDTQQNVEVQVPRQQDTQQNAFDQAQHQHPQQEQEQRQEQHHADADFLDQLRLGLVPESEEQA